MPTTRSTLMNDAKYMGLDVHQATISVAVLDVAGKLVMEAILETKAETILQFVHGLRGSHIATLVERHSRFVMLIKIPSRDTVEVVGALSKHVRKLPATLRRSLTWDRGLEMAKHKDFTVATDVKVYFCDPQSPWQRGSNENTNGLLRQYFPKNTDLSIHSQAQ